MKFSPKINSIYTVFTILLSSHLLSLHYKHEGLTNLSNHCLHPHLLVAGFDTRKVHRQSFSVLSCMCIFLNTKKSVTTNVITPFGFIDHTKNLCKLFLLKEIRNLKRLFRNIAADIAGACNPLYRSCRLRMCCRSAASRNHIKL